MRLVSFIASFWDPYRREYRRDWWATRRSEEFKSRRRVGKPGRWRA